MADIAMQNRGQNPPSQPQGNLIRSEQVKKLPHLSDAQKAQHEKLIQTLWDTINNNQPGSENYHKAHQRLLMISTTLMNAMKQYHAAKNQRQQQPQAPQAAAQAGSNSASNNNVLFSQLNPQIQQRVNEQHFYYPPQMVEGSKQADDWLREAKARYGQALQRSEVAKSKMKEFQRTAQQRQQSGNPLNQQEMEVFNSKLSQCQKAIAEANSFMEKFREQQATFQRQQPQHRFSNQVMATQNDSNEPPVSATMQPNSGAPGPQAHSIDSAVAAARNQAAANQTTTDQKENQGQLSNNATPITQNFTQQSPFNPQQVHPDQMGVLRQQSQTGMGMHATQPYNSQQPQSATHAHPPAIMNAMKKDDRQLISKNLNVAEPKPVPVPAARPTITGGPSIGMAGQMGQPAIPQMPGYVLESSEDGRLLSKKRLNDLVREVCGPGGDEQLTPEVEDMLLQITDDFVDDLTSAACKLAKVRGSSTLDVRDIQVVLERQYNIRIPGFSTDEIRTVRRSQPALAWGQKMGAVQAAKLTGGVNNAVNGVKDT